MMFLNILKRKLQKRNYTSSHFWLLILALLVLSACNKRFSGIFDSEPRLDVKEVQFDYLSSKAKIDYESEEQSVSGTANIRVRKDSVIWVSLSPALGIEAARVLVTQDSVTFLEKVNKYYAVYSFAELSKKLQFEVNYKMVESVILGNLIYPYDREKIIKTSKTYNYDQHHGSFHFENEIGVESMKLENIQVTDTLSRNSVSVNYTDFQLVEDQIFPFLIKSELKYADLKKQPVKVTIEYKQHQIEKKPLKFPINIPQRYERK